jgi:type I restriction enzyme S subunit
LKTIDFGSLFESIRNGANLRQEPGLGGVPISRIETISSGRVDPDRVGYAGVSGDSYPNYILKYGDILFSHINSPNRVGQCALYQSDPPVLVHGMNLLRLRCKPCVEPSFIRHLIESPGFKRSLQRYVNRAVNQASISVRNLSGIEVRIPPLAEQRRIARVLDQAETLRHHRRRSLDCAAALVQALFVEMFGDIDDSADSIALADLVEASRPITYGILKPGPDIPGGVPYVRVVDIADGEIVADGVRRTSTTIASEYRRSVLAPGDLVMSIRGHVGRLAVVPDNLGGANITQDSARIAIRDFDPRYVIEAIRGPSIQRWMSRHVKGVAVQGINLADVKRIPIPVAAVSAQREFAARAREADRVVTSAREHLRHLNALFLSLRHRAFIGEL